MNRRAFISRTSASLLALRSLPAQAQPANRVPLVAVLMGVADDEEAQARIKAIEAGFAEKGWLPGKNLKLEYRFSASDPKRMLSLSEELVALHPDVIIAHSTPVVAALHKVTHTIPIVFVVVGDPIGSGFVASMARPGGNITGFSVMWPTITGKYLSILRQLKPELSRVALMYNPESTRVSGTLAVETFRQSAKEYHVVPVVAQVNDAAEIDTLMDQLGPTPGVALAVMPGNVNSVNRQRIILHAAKWRIPAIYPYRYFAEEGGLLSYGINVLEPFRRAPDYVDRILHGARPADLPVQAPMKFELVINLKTARALRLTIPRVLLAGADALIE